MIKPRVRLNGNKSTGMITLSSYDDLELPPQLYKLLYTWVVLGVVTKGTKVSMYKLEINCEHISNEALEALYYEIKGLFISQGFEVLTFDDIPVKEDR